MVTVSAAACTDVATSAAHTTAIVVDSRLTRADALRRRTLSHEGRGMVFVQFLTVIPFSPCGRRGRANARRMRGKSNVYKYQSYSVGGMVRRRRSVSMLLVSR